MTLVRARTKRQDTIYAHKCVRTPRIVYINSFTEKQQLDMYSGCWKLKKIKV